MGDVVLWLFMDTYSSCVATIIQELKMNMNMNMVKWNVEAESVSL